MNDYDSYHRSSGFFEEAINVLKSKPEPDDRHWCITLMNASGSLGINRRAHGQLEDAVTVLQQAVDAQHMIRPLILDLQPSMRLSQALMELGQYH
jgi:hypothetical protein